MRRIPLPILIVGSLPFLFGFNLLESTNRDVEEGNAALKAGKPEDALKSYDKAAARLPADPGVHFDRGAALHALKRWDEAAQEFLRATEARDVKLKQSAFYNLGNAFYEAQKYKEAVEAYKRSLVLDPRDMKAKWNLELALVKKKDEEKKKSEQNQNDDQQKQDQQKQDQQKQDQQKQDQQKQDQQKQDQGKQDQQKQDEGQDQKQDQQKQQGQPQPKETGSQDQREIKAILDSLERSPKNLEQERARLRAVRRRPPEKDW